MPCFAVATHSEISFNKRNVNIELWLSIVFNLIFNTVSRGPNCPGRKDVCSFTSNEEFILSVNPPLQYQGDNAAAQDGETSNTCFRLESVKSITPPCASLPKLLQWLHARPVADSTGNFSTSCVSKVVEPQASSHWTRDTLSWVGAKHCTLQSFKTENVSPENGWPTLPGLKMVGWAIKKFVN